MTKGAKSWEIGIPECGLQHGKKGFFFLFSPGVNTSRKLAKELHFLGMPLVGTVTNTKDVIKCFLKV